MHDWAAAERLLALLLVGVWQTLGGEGVRNAAVQVSLSLLLYDFCVLCNQTEQKGINSFRALSYKNEPVILRQAVQASCSQVSPYLYWIPAGGGSAAP